MRKHYLYSGELIFQEPFLLGISMDYVLKKFSERDYQLSVQEKEVINCGSFSDFMEIYKKCVSEVKDYWKKKGYSEEEFCLPQYFVPNYSYWAADKDSINGKCISPAFLFCFKHNVMLWTALPLVEADKNSYNFEAEFEDNED